jgi:ABC-type Fe3+/spermidine/putrescine transport system ATPase subunit
MKTNYLKIKNLEKKLGNFLIRKISFELKKGEMLILLGHSGSGKSTIIRLISGLLTPDGGEIKINGKDIKKIKTYQRNIGLVFQDFALFPHLNVFENIAFGLKIKKKSKKEIENRVNFLLKTVGLAGYQNRKIQMLSGGEKQRIALARTLAPEPDLILFDEPLSALDENMRVNLRKEIKRIQKKINFTGIFVTHDRKEAFELGDKIALISNGKMLQFGEPKSLYLNPKTPEVAEFIGINNNFFGKIIHQEKNLKIAEMNKVEIQFESDNNYELDDKIAIYIKTELCSFSNEKKEQNCFETKISKITDYGQNIEVITSIGENVLKISMLRPNIPLAELWRMKYIVIPIQSINVFRR